MSFLRTRRPRPPAFVVFPVPLRRGVWGFSRHALKCGEPTQTGQQCRKYARVMVCGEPACRQHRAALEVRHDVEPLREFVGPLMPEMVDGHPVERPWKRWPWLVKSLYSYAVWCTRCGARASVSTPVTHKKLGEEQARFADRHGACPDAAPQGQGSLFG